jgi:hypothetical protein
MIPSILKRSISQIYFSWGPWMERKKGLVLEIDGEEEAAIPYSD